MLKRQGRRRGEHRTSKLRPQKAVRLPKLQQQRLPALRLHALAAQGLEPHLERSLQQAVLRTAEQVIHRHQIATHHHLQALRRPEIRQ